MNFVKRQALAVLVLVVLAASFSYASTPQPPAAPRDYVIDLAGVMPDVGQKLNGLLQELERKTSSQVLVLTVQSLDGQSIEEFSFETKEKWKLGQKGKDNGVLIVVAVKDRKYRFEVGYGLESILPDSLVGSIGRQYLVPYFRQGDYGTGTYAAALAIANTIAADAGVEISGMPHLPRPAMNGTDQQGIPPFIVGIIFIVVVILFVTHPKQCILIMLMNSMGGRGGWSGGGGGFGGGGGSFGGGGGGSGGGGGASGSW